MKFKALLIAQLIAVCAANWLETGGSRFWLSENQVNFSVAEQACQDMGASILSCEVDANRIVPNFDQDLQYWTKLVFDGTDYFWSNGVYVGRSHWGPNDPNEMVPCARYKYYEESTRHLLADYYCNSEYNYVCVNSPDKGSRFSLLLNQDVSTLDSLCLLSTHVTRSQVACAARCSLDPNCGYFYYDVTTLSCELLYLGNVICQESSYTGKSVFTLTGDECV